MPNPRTTPENPLEWLMRPQCGKGMIGREITTVAATRPDRRQNWGLEPAAGFAQ